jgi:hypothetical protein
MTKNQNLNESSRMSQLKTGNQRTFEVPSQAFSGLFCCLFASKGKHAGCMISNLPQLGVSRFFTSGAKTKKLDFDSKSENSLSLGFSVEAPDLRHGDSRGLI